jgi:hypothetical protein
MSRKGRAPTPKCSTILQGIKVRARIYQPTRVPRLFPGAWGTLQCVQFYTAVRVRVRVLEYTDSCIRCMNHPGRMMQHKSNTLGY